MDMLDRLLAPAQGSATTSRLQHELPDKLLIGHGAGLPRDGCRGMEYLFAAWRHQYVCTVLGFHVCLRHGILFYLVVSALV